MVPGALDLEVLVVSYNSAGTLASCFASIERTMPGTRIAVREHGDDQGAYAALVDLAGRHPAPVRVEADPSNPGFGAGCNALATTSEAAVVLFLNPDAEVVTWPWSADDPPPSDSIIGPLMVESGDPSRHWGLDYRVRDEIARSWLRRRPAAPTGTGFVSGAALLIGRAPFLRVGGFDTGYFLFYEDIDLCLRAATAGIGTRVDRRWTVRHEGAHSTRPRFARSLMWSYESAIRFHGGRGSPVGAYRLYVASDALLRSALHLVRRDRGGALAYLLLARRAAGDLLSGRWPRPRPGGRGRPSSARAGRS